MRITIEQVCLALLRVQLYCDITVKIHGLVALTGGVSSYLSNENKAVPLHGTVNKQRAIILITTRMAKNSARVVFAFEDEKPKLLKKLQNDDITCMVHHQVIQLHKMQPCITRWPTVQPSTLDI